VFPNVEKCCNEELTNMTASLECVSQHLKKLMSSVNPPPKVNHLFTPTTAVLVM
jgi:hypothetical protein